MDGWIFECPHALKEKTEELIVQTDALESLFLLSSKIWMLSPTKLPGLVSLTLLHSAPYMFDLAFIVMSHLQMRDRNAQI